MPSTVCIKVKRDKHVQQLQREWYWVILLVMFFVEREAITDILILVLSFLYENFK